MPTKNRRELSGRQRTFVSLWVGLGFLIVGLYQAITPHSYPPGDIRASPLFWPILGLITALIGVAILLWTARTAWVSRNHRT